MGTNSETPTKTEIIKGAFHLRDEGRISDKQALKTALAFCGKDPEGLRYGNLGSAVSLLAMTYKASRTAVSAS